MNEGPRTVITPVCPPYSFRSPAINQWESGRRAITSTARALAELAGNIPEAGVTWSQPRHFRVQLGSNRSPQKSPLFCANQKAPGRQSGGFLVEPGRLFSNFLSGERPSSGAVH